MVASSVHRVNLAVRDVIEQLEDRLLLSVAAGTSGGFAVTDQLVVTTQPRGSVSAGQPVGLVVAAEDARGVTDTSFNGVVTIDDEYQDLTGALTATAVKGIATFSTVAATSAETQSIHLQSSGLPDVFTNNFTVLPAAASQLAFFPANYGTVVNGISGIAIEPLDQFGNLALSYDSPITLALTGNPGGARLQGTVTATPADGLADFPSIYIDTAGTYTFTASAPGLPSAISAPFAVIDQLVFTTQPTTSIAGHPFETVVSAEDANGRVDTSFNGAVTVSSDDFTATVQAVNGVATFPALKEDYAADQNVLFASSPGLTEIASNFFTVNPGPAVQLVVANAPVNGVINTAMAPLYVLVEDSLGNNVTSFDGNVTLSLQSNSAGARLGGTVTEQALGPVVIFSKLLINKAGDNYVLNASGSGLTAGASAPFSVGDQLMFTSQPASSIVSGSVINLVVKAYSSAGTVDTSFNSIVSISDSYGNTLGGNTTVTAVKGVATFSGLSDSSTGTGDAFIASSIDTSTLTGSATSKPFSVVPLAATRLLVSPPEAAVKNAPFGITVGAVDPLGNIVSNFVGTVTLSLAATPAGANLGGTLTANVINGYATFTGLTLNELGSGYKLKATAPGIGSGTSSPFAVQDKLVVTTPPPDTLTVDEPFGLVVTAEDGLGHVDKSFKGIVSVADTDGYATSGKLAVTAVKGVATFTGLSYTQAYDNTSLTATAAGATAAISEPLSVSQITLLSLDLVGPDEVAGSPFGFEVFTTDSNGVDDTDYTGTLTISLGAHPAGGTLSGTLTADASNGGAYFDNIILNKAGSGYTLIASAPGIPSVTSVPITVTDTLVFTQQPPGGHTAGTPFGVVVKAEDGVGDVDPSFTGDVAISDLNGNPLGGTVSVAAVKGVAIFSGITLDTATAVGSSDQIVATDQSAVPILSNPFTVIGGPATKLVVTAVPNGAIVNGALVSSATGAVTVLAEDQYGNQSPAFNGKVTLALAANPAGGALVGTLTTTAVNGEADFTNLKINKAGDNDTLKATAASLTSGISVPFDVTDQLVVTSPPPAAVTAGKSFGLTVTAEDANGVIDTAFTGNISVDDEDDADPLGGTVTIKAVHGKAVFTGLTDDIASPNTVIDAVSSGLATVQTRTFTVNPAAATQLVFGAGGPANGLVNGPLLTDADIGIAIVAEDPYGNVDTNFSGNVTVSLGGGTGGATLGGMALTEPAISGEADFASLTINKTGYNYTLKAAATKLAAVLSPVFEITDQLVVTTQPPLTPTAGDPFTVVVKAEDANGVLDTSFNSPVYLSDDESYPIGGPTMVTASKGVATFAGLSVEIAQNDDFNFFSGPLIVSTNFVNPIAAPATHLVFDEVPDSVESNGAFSLAVIAEDQFGNIDTSFTGNVTLTMATASDNGTLGGGVTVQAVAGIARFDAVTITAVGSAYTIKASSAEIGFSDTYPISVVDQLVVTKQPPATVTAGASFGIVVSAEDANGVLDPSFDGVITIIDTDNQNTLGGTLSVTAVNGVATFTGLTEDAAGSQAIYISSDNLDSQQSNSFTVVAGAATQLVVIPPAGVIANGPFALTVNAEDAFGNIDTSFNGSVTLSLSANPAAAKLGGALSVKAVNGVATFSSLTLNKVASGFSIKASLTKPAPPPGLHHCPGNPWSYDWYLGYLPL